MIRRREFLGGAVSLLAAAAAGGCASAPAPAARGTTTFAYVGAYTSKERNGHGDGINVYRMDPASGFWTHVQLVKDHPNPSWLAVDHQQRFLYAAHGDGAEASAFAIDKRTGHLTSLNRQATGGKNGVRLAADSTDRFIVLANYSSGSVAALPINANGSFGKATDLVTLVGTPGPHRMEQTSSHPHDIVFDPRGRFVIVPDKGFDAVFVFRLDTATGKLVPGDVPSVLTRPGAGPRHADFHPSKDFMYLINELDSTVTAYRFDAARGELKPIQVITTLPPTFTGTSVTAEIAVAPSGRFVYGSNRGHDSIVTFAVDDAAGTLTPVGWESTQGRTPRFFALDPSGTFLYAANQDSDTIVTFRIDQATGKLNPIGHVVKTGSPSSIVFVSGR